MKTATQPRLQDNNGDAPIVVTVQTAINAAIAATPAPTAITSEFAKIEIFSEAVNCLPVRSLRWPTATIVRSAAGRLKTIKAMPSPGTILVTAAKAATIVVHKNIVLKLNVHFKLA